MKAGIEKHTMIYIITAVHNRYEITYKFIQQIKCQTYQDGIHLILVDDGSTDGTADMVERECNSADKELNLSCTVLRGNGKLWWGGALHLAYKWVTNNLIDALDDYVLISNDDVIWKDDYLQTAVQILEEYDQAEGRAPYLLSGKGYSINTGELLDKVYYHDYTDRIGDSSRVSETGIGDCCSTRSLFMHVKDMLAIGGFHPILLPHYLSDYEWTMRAAKKGYQIRSDNRLCYQFDEGTTGDNTYEKLTIKKMFSKRSAANPIYKITGIFLMTPKRYIPRELKKQFGRYFQKLNVLKQILKNSK